MEIQRMLLYQNLLKSKMGHCKGVIWILDDTKHRRDSQAASCEVWNKPSHYPPYGYNTDTKGINHSTSGLVITPVLVNKTCYDMWLCAPVPQGWTYFLLHKIADFSRTSPHETKWVTLPSHGWYFRCAYIQTKIIQSISNLILLNKNVSSWRNDLTSRAMDKLLHATARLRGCLSTCHKHVECLVQISNCVDIQYGCYPSIHFGCI